jgi:hypothetical protein
LQQLIDTSQGSQQRLPKELLIDSALVTIRDAAGMTDTLSKTSEGLYITTTIRLISGTQYTLTVHDYRKGMTAHAITTYVPQPMLEQLTAVKVVTPKETQTKLELSVIDAKVDDYYFVSYNTMRNARENAIPLPLNQRALNLFVPKQIELFTGAGAKDGLLNKSLTLQVKPDDTLMLHVARIDKAYYNYLVAYKRTGALFNQLTGEPINLPSNISGGYGFFSLYQPIRKVYNLNQL